MCGCDSDIARLKEESYHNQAAISPSSDTQSYGRGIIPESLQNPRLDVLYRRALTTVPNSGLRDPLRRLRDAKLYTNPDMPCTVAYDPVATIPTTATARSVTSYSKNNPSSKKRMMTCATAQGTQSHIRTPICLGALAPNSYILYRQ